ncbi:MAG: outer membrane protein transport protein [Bacteroidetes bacterium]|nr:outer membrane protein transport protein [Bacteroidota bacterium]
MEQAVLFSRQNAGGSARIQAMGGAQVALGGDFSSGQSNPAGLGFYNRNEFTITPAITLQSADATYRTAEFDGSNNIISSRFNSSHSGTFGSLPGLSAVFGANKNDDRAPFLGGTFSISLNRVNDFNGGFEYKGQNNGTSIVDYMLEASNGYSKDQFDPNYDPNSNSAGKGDNVNTPAFLGYENYLIGPTTANGTTYFTDITGKPLQSELVKTSGSQNQWSIAYGANFMDKVFLGASVGIVSVRYEYDKTYKESFAGQAMNCNGCFNSLELKENRGTTGNGVNLTLGAIFKPVEFFQVGASYTTPTVYQLSDTYNASMNTSWNNFDYYEDGSKILSKVNSSTYDDPVSYSLSTPARFTFGAAVFYPKKGFITLDVEMINYSRATMSSFSTQYYSLSIDGDADVNRVVSARFTSATNLRMGGEYRLKKFRLRGGYSIMGDPYLRKPTDRVNYSLTGVSSITGGIGYRDTTFFIDLAVTNTQGNGYYVPYAVASDISPNLNYSNTSTRIMFTVGFPF